jgi:putative hydrolase of the HAD superfamily
MQFKSAACKNKACGKLMKNLRLVSFDVWDTLLSVRAYYRDVAVELSKLVGVEPAILEGKLVEGYGKIRAIRRTGGFSDSEIVQSSLKTMAKFLNLDSEIVARAILNATENSRSEQYIIEGAAEAIRQVKELGFKVIVVGNVVFWPGSYNRVLLERAGLSKFFNEQFYADELKVSKPKPEIFAKALARFNVQPWEALHVGDSLFEDLVGAVLAQMNAALIDKNVKGVVRLSSWNAYIIQNIGLLEQVIRELEKH